MRDKSEKSSQRPAEGPNAPKVVSPFLLREASQAANALLASWALQELLTRRTSKVTRG